MRGGHSTSSSSSHPLCFVLCARGVQVLFGKADVVVELVVERSGVGASTLLSFLQHNFVRHFLADDALVYTAEAERWMTEADLWSTQATALTFGDVPPHHHTSHHQPHHTPPSLHGTGVVESTVFCC